MNAALSDLKALFSSLGQSTAVITGADPVLPTRFRVGEAAAGAIGAVASAAAGLWQRRGGKTQDIKVDVRRSAASLTGFRHLRLDGKPFPAAQGDVPTMAIYRCRDGRWIHLHGALPHLRDGTLKILACENDRTAIAAAVMQWDSGALEDALARAGQCGAILRTAQEWTAHDQGRAVSSEPLVTLERIGDAPPLPLPRAERPLSGVRVLDLTRILAGPTCARSLAEHGAEVLHISSPHLPSIPIFIPDTGHGKRAAFLHLSSANDAETLRGLLATADVFSQGYRRGGMERLGFGPNVVAKLRPGIIYVSINCYGHAGPWADHPGWEQLAQSCTGIALEHSGKATDDNAPPEVIPAAPSDYCTGYLAALGVMAALQRRADEGGSWHVKASLARTAMWFQRLGMADTTAAREPISRSEIDAWSLERYTPWGRLGFLGPVAQMSLTPPSWSLPAVPLGHHAPAWASSISTHE